MGKREVKEGNGDDLTQEPDKIKAFRDTWESYLRELALILRLSVFYVFRVIVRQARHLPTG